jgi:large subunit ribosomal protein L7/L12
MADEMKKQEATEEQKPAEAAAEAPASEAKAEEKPKVQVSAKMEGIIKNIEEMSVLELSELVKALEDKFGVSAAAPVAAMAVPGAAGAAGGAEAEEKSVFSVVLASVGSNKINVIKEIRALTSLGLKEAKDLVEAAPKEIKGDVPKDEADKMKKQLEETGAKIELK